MSQDNGRSKPEIDPLAVLHGGFHHGMVVPDANAFYRLPVRLHVDGSDHVVAYDEIYKPRRCTDKAKVWPEPWLTERPEALVIVEQMKNRVVDAVRCKFAKAHNRISHGVSTPLGILRYAAVVVGLKEKPTSLSAVGELLDAEILVCPVMNPDGSADCRLNEKVGYKLCDHILNKDAIEEDRSGHDNANTTAGP